jgi:A/G-specific adenine glycosylase
MRRIDQSYFGNKNETLFQPKEDLTPEVVRTFQELIYGYYRIYGRTFPWRETRNPYEILVSEIMLQQTQAKRVISKYGQFIKTFPNFPVLAAAPLQEILKVWSGLGYNRRALYLKKTADIVVGEFQSILPSDPDTLTTLPGIGRATASAIAAFAFDSPTAFVETNIRTVFIHFFFQNKTAIKDKDILTFVKKTLDYENPREWYYALTDYGVMLKKHTRCGKRSARYQKQPPFEGSNRQVRGKILNILVMAPIHESRIIKKLDIDPQRIRKILNELKKEGFIKRKGNLITISS